MNDNVLFHFSKKLNLPYCSLHDCYHLACRKTCYNSWTDFSTTNIYLGANVNLSQHFQKLRRTTTQTEKSGSGEGQIMTQPAATKKSCGKKVSVSNENGSDQEDKPLGKKRGKAAKAEQSSNDDVSEEETKPRKKRVMKSKATKVEKSVGALGSLMEA